MIISFYIPHLPGPIFNRTIYIHSQNMYDEIAACLLGAKEMWTSFKGLQPLPFTSQEQKKKERKKSQLEAKEKSGVRQSTSEFS